MANPSEAIEIRDEGDEEDLIDQEQLDEYRDMVDSLGEHPDRVKINSLSMVAEDYSDSKPAATAIYQIIRDRLLKSPRDKLLPLVYAIDSIIKNARGHYTSVVEEDARNWMPSVYRQLPELQKAKLKKVWETWRDARIFSAEHIQALGQCFDDNVSGKSLSSSMSQVAGINRTKDGTLLLPKTLRTEMENTLEDMQKDVPERDKISLERLAEINPNLLQTIKETAQTNISAMGSFVDLSAKEIESGLPSFFTETRSPDILKHAAAWKAHAMDTVQEATETTDAIMAQIDKIYQERFTQDEALSMTQYAGTASAVAKFITQVVDTLQKEQEVDKKNRKILPQASTGFQVDRSLFTNDGIKQKNTAVIGILYEVGLPFQSSADGRRFRTQLELSKHLDALFKRAQLEKSISRAEERGWYITDNAWQGQAEEVSAQTSTDPAVPDATVQSPDDGYDPETNTMPADENRDRCVVCGLNFRMFFDNEEGIYQYKNCREIEVLNDDEVALNESEQMLVHVTCWRALGSPEVLTTDQALQDTVRH